MSSPSSGRGSSWALHASGRCSTSVSGAARPMAANRRPVGTSHRQAAGRTPAAAEGPGALRRRERRGPQRRPPAGPHRHDQLPRSRRLGPPADPPAPVRGVLCRGGPRWTGRAPRPLGESRSVASATRHGSASAIRRPPRDGRRPAPRGVGPTLDRLQACGAVGDVHSEAPGHRRRQPTAPRRPDAAAAGCTGAPRYCAPWSRSSVATSWPWTPRRWMRSASHDSSPLPPSTPSGSAGLSPEPARCPDRSASKQVRTASGNDGGVRGSAHHQLVDHRLVVTSNPWRSVPAHRQGLAIPDTTSSDSWPPGSPGARLF